MHHTKHPLWMPAIYGAAAFGLQTFVYTLFGDVSSREQLLKNFVIFMVSAIFVKIIIYFIEKNKEKQK